MCVSVCLSVCPCVCVLDMMSGFANLASAENPLATPNHPKLDGQSARVSRLKGWLTQILAGPCIPVSSFWPSGLDRSRGWQIA